MRPFLKHSRAASDRCAVKTLLNREPDAFPLPASCPFLLPSTDPWDPTTWDREPPKPVSSSSNEGLSFLAIVQRLSLRQKCPTVKVYHELNQT